MLELCLLNTILYYQYYTTYYNFFAWNFYHFIFLPTLEGYIVRITNYDYDKYFSIDTGGKSGGRCDAKLKVNNIKIDRKVMLVYKNNWNVFF